MSCVTCNCSIIAVLCKLNKDDLESNIIMNRLIHLRYIKIQINGNGVYIFCQIRIYFSWLISLGPHTIVIAYNPESTIPGASYGQCHTCFLKASLRNVFRLKLPFANLSFHVIFMQNCLNFHIEWWDKIIVKGKVGWFSTFFRGNEQRHASRRDKQLEY